jgi:hypothetical protein
VPTAHINRREDMLNVIMVVLGAFVLMKVEIGESNLLYLIVIVAGVVYILKLLNEALSND